MAQVIESMPKKTKQEKIIANLRRQLEVTQQQKTFREPERIVQVNPIKKTTIPAFQVSNSLSDSNQSLGLIKKDLTKTLILSILAISFELVLYFLLRTGSI